MRHLFRIMLAFGATACACVCAAADGPAEGLAKLVSYTSQLDGSTQVYGVYLPATPAPTAAGYPTVFHMHGYGWSVSADFSDFQRQWADQHGWIIINLNARGPQFYEGVGDVETRNVIRDANQRFGLDMSRLYITGGSMGGTGAFRLAIRYPDLFAAAVGVDGWSDFREWHSHWYARTDQQDEIEEFRRPLLEACSPLYWTGRARWGQVQASVSGQDNVVLPDNGISLYNALRERGNNLPGAYEARLYLDADKGHGGSYRIDQIYEFFAHRSLPPQPSSFMCESTLLTHGDLYWGGLERLKVQGANASLESDVKGSIVSARTKNLAQFCLHLQASPAADQATVTVYVDGFAAYSGPPCTVHFQADWSPTGQLWGWQEYEPQGLRKTARLEGPVGEAFKVPFVVVYGTAGTPYQNAQNKREAVAFARGWNDFMVHGLGVTALPEEELSTPDLQNKSLILFATEDTSTLLQQANATHELPVHIGFEGITVRDPKWGDREYLGTKYGAFLCYPNPLSEFRTYLVVCHGQWSTKPNGTEWQGLEYDLEKLPWAYSDYVIYDTDYSELPLVTNVNNKPPVTTYEAGYFVEAGWFDQNWQPYRAATLDRVLAQKLPVKVISVSGLEATGQGAKVTITDATGTPIPKARVTVRFVSNPPQVVSGVTGADGAVSFRAVSANGTEVPECQIVNIEATGAVYNWLADRCQSTMAKGKVLRLATTACGEDGLTTANVEVGSPESAQVQLALVAPVGKVYAPLQQLTLQPGLLTRVSFCWEAQGVPPGTYPLKVTARFLPGGPVLERTTYVAVGDWPQASLKIMDLKATDITEGKPYQVSARLLNLSPINTVNGEVHCSLPDDSLYLAPQKLLLKPQEEATIIFTPPAGEPPLLRGVHPVRVVVPQLRGVTATSDFTVK